MKKRKSFLRRSSKAKEGEASSLAEAAAKVASLDVDSNDDSLDDNIEPPHEETPPYNDPIDRQETLTPKYGFMSVNQACEEMWKCTGAKETAELLQVLHTALLRTPLKDYIPSDVFVCISGAALRFHEHEEENHQQESDFESLWQVWEEALWATAALARVCVGAAWRSQVKQRSEWLHRKKQALVDEDTRRRRKMADEDGSSKSSSRGRRSMPFLPLDLMSTDSKVKSKSKSPVASKDVDLPNSTVYPSIPENLPAAMLRFAAMEMPFPSRLDKENADQQRWIDRQKSLAEAQQELVLALCYILPEEEPDTPEAMELEWTILEAHDPVASMVHSWLQSAATNWQSVNSMNSKSDTLSSGNTSSDGDDKTLVDSGGSIQSRPSSSHSGKQVRQNQQDDTKTNISMIKSYDGDIDWWAALQVVRATLQLVSAGWRLPQDKIGEDIISYLVELAERGMLLRVNELKSFGNESDRVVREERLAASSSAMTAVSVLAAIASVGLVPHSKQVSITERLSILQIQVASSDESTPDQFPSGNSMVSTEQVAWRNDYQTFLDQRGDCISEIEALYWVLLAQSSSSASTMAVFLEMMYLEANGGTDGESHASASSLMDRRTMRVQTARIAVDAVSGALWGIPPDMPGVVHLRICWYNFLRAIAGIAYRIHLWVVDLDRGWDDTAGEAVMNRKFVHKSLLLLLDVVISLNRLVNEEILRGEGILAPDEWDVLVDLLNENVDKWLCMTDGTVALAAETSLLVQIQHEVRKLLDKLRRFFDICAQFEMSAFNLVVEDECRVKLFSLLLQKAVPYLPPENGTLLALSVLRCWSATDFTIHKSETWARNASYIITDVFSMFDDRNFGRFKGYVHSPAVRLEALKLIAFGEEDERSLLDTEQIQRSEQRSPLEMSLHFREQYLALVNGSLLPPLMTMFGAQSSNIHVAIVVPVPFASFSATRIPLGEEMYHDPSATGDWKQTVTSDESELRRFAVKLLGRLYRSGTGETFHRSSLLKMMLSVAVGNSLEESRHSVDSWDVDSDTVFAGESSTPLQAIQEFGKCLSLPFRSMPNAHESFPPVMDALCSILIVYGGEPLRERGEYNESFLAMKRSLAIATVLPLARLGISHDMRLVLGNQQCISGLVPELFVRKLAYELKSGDDEISRVSHDGLLAPEVAPFIVVTDDSQRPEYSTKHANERTKISFVSVLSSLLATLVTNLESKRARGDRGPSGTVSSGDVPLHQPMEVLDSNFRSLCFGTLGAFLRGGMYFPFTKELVTILRPKAGDVTAAEALARCKCTAAALEYIVTRCEVARESLDIYSDDIGVFLEDLLSFCTSKRGNHVTFGCQSLRGVVGFIDQYGTLFGPHVVVALLDRLKAEVDCFREGRVSEQVVAESLLSLLYDIVSASNERETPFLPMEILVQVFDICLDICLYQCWMPDSETCQEICARLIDLVLNNLQTTDTTVGDADDLILTQLEAKFLDIHAVASSQMNGLEGIQGLEQEASRCKLLGDVIARHRSTLPCRQMISSIALASTHHESVAQETDNINRFVPEEADLDQEATCSAWLCGESTLLTFRLGSLESRYRGWLEVVVRSPTTKSRRMIRIPTIISLDDPELPSSMWDDQSITELEVSDSSPQGVPDEMMNRFTEPSEAMNRASAVMSKFDAMFGQSNNGTIPSQPSHTEVVGDNTSSWDTISYQSSIANAFREDARNVEQWLHMVLKDSIAVAHVRDELDTLGIPSALLSATAASKVDGLDSHFVPVERLSFSSKFRRALSIVDRIPPFNTHKVAILRATDDLEDEIGLTNASLEDMLLSSTSGSPKFLAFTEGLGKLVLSKHLKYYSGGLDASGFDADGNLSLVWLDRNDALASNMVVFHVVPFLPAGLNNRKRHVGNDNVHIVYVEPGCALDKSLRQGHLNRDTVPCLISGEFGFVIIFVQTLAGQGRMKVSARLRNSLADDIQSRLDHLVGEHLVSESAAPALVRRVAIHADVSCHAIMEDLLGKPNWEERQYQIATMSRYKLK